MAFSTPVPARPLSSMTSPTASICSFLTTDDSLRLRALREASKLSVHVENPAKWYAKVITP
jgi:hypothetical protein